MAGIGWQNSLTLLLVLVFVAGCFGSRHGRKDDDHHEKDGGWAWNAAAGLAVIFGIAVAGAAIFSLIGWLTCTIHTKCRKDKVNISTVKIGSASPTPPYWTQHLVYKPELGAGFGVVSDGFLRIGPAHLVRNRPGTAYTDGAKWAVPMTRGKHVFEITWPWGHRGYHATVGLGTEDAALTAKGTRPLVGSTVKTWGLDIVKRRTHHSNKPIATCPTDGSYVPDKFLMYVDMDEGTLGFGNDVTYWGEVVQGLPFQGTKPLYLMVGASKWQSELSVVYKGSAPDGTDAKPVERPPHHLPPLYHVSSHAPPMYTEYNGDSKTSGGDAASTSAQQQPQAPPQDLMYGPPPPPTPPPPYSRPPAGFNPDKF